ncbi:MAG: acyl-CoA thioesterase [bacterium]|nr:acyl-CoA thioesterase [bacterium]
MTKIPRSQQEPLTSSLTVASYELDSFGHVNNAVFLNYLEKARCDFMLAKGLSFNDFSKWNTAPVVSSANMEFKSPAVADDVLLIKGWITEHTATSFTLQYEISNNTNGRLVLTGETVHVFINENNRPCRIPEPFKNKFIPRL